MFFRGKNFTLGLIYCETNEVLLEFHAIIAIAISYWLITIITINIK